MESFTNQAHKPMPSNCLPPTVPGRVLQETIAELQTINRWSGFGRFGLLGVATVGCIALAWTTDIEIIFWSWTVLAGLFYAIWLFCTHDAVHHTLLGLPTLEELLARIISWPMFWPVGVYAELHRLHHSWNGLDSRDPERIQWTEQEYQAASPLVQWYVRHQWMIDVFILGGFGVVIKTLMGGRRFQDVLSRLRFQLYADLLGITIVQGCIITAVIFSQASVLRYLLFWLCLERVIGVIAQTRAHLEHYGLWGQVGGHQLTQLYSARNLHASRWFSWLIGGLNYHALHHAFPRIPFDQLPEAHGRIEAVLSEHGMPAMETEQRYIGAIWRGVSRCRLIS